MGIGAFIFAMVAFYALLRLANVEIYHFMSTGSFGPEGGLIDSALASLVGLVASAVALLLSYLHLRRNRNAQGNRVLFAWCCVLPLGFLIVFAKMAVDYSHAQGR